MKRWSMAAIVAGAAVLVALGFFAGRALRPESGAAYGFEADGPAMQAVTAAATSQGGFTGFVEDTEARTVISGRVVTASDTSITVQRPDGTTAVLRVTPQAPLRRLEPSDAGAIRPGAQVLVRRDGDNAAAVLVLAAR